MRQPRIKNVCWGRCTTCYSSLFTTSAKFLIIVPTEYGMQVIRCKSASKHQYVKWKFTAMHHKTRSESDNLGREKNAPITRIFICWNWSLFLSLITQFQKKMNSIKAECHWKECLACHLCSFGTFWVLFDCSYWLIKHNFEENKIRDKRFGRGMAALLSPCLLKIQWWKGVFGLIMLLHLWFTALSQSLFLILIDFWFLILS